MEYKSLSKLFYSDKESYEKIYQSRFNNEQTVHLNFEVSGFPAFFVPDSSFFQIFTDIYKTDKSIKALREKLPEKAIDQFALRCLIDEIILTNDIEGVFSSRREINSVLSELKTKSRGKRYSGLVQKYLMLQKDESMSFRTCEDIRNLYNDLVCFEVAEDNPENLPDGKIFRKDSTSVVSATQKEIHRGIYPESNIIETMNKALDILNNDEIPFLFRVSVFHYLFGYIHPFYDGNGRTSRFISSYLLSKEFESIIAYRISFSIKENINEYYQAFKTCNDKHNKGDLTPFIFMFINIIRKSFHLLENALVKRYEQLKHYSDTIQHLPNGLNEKYVDIYFLLIQASLFSENGISTQEIMEVSRLSRTTITNRLKTLSEDNLIIKKTFGNMRCYSLNLDVVDELAALVLDDAE
ncbi:MAG: Fic family protein [Ruminococcus sp.]|nr:Fic family protein [Ruminococcus sp.]